MAELKRCPDCETELNSQLVLTPAPRYDKPDDFPQFAYVEYWTCPNLLNHGTYVKCENGCDELVKNPRQHYSYTPGLIGSGKWRCFKPLPKRCHKPALDQPVYPPDPPGVTTIRYGGYVVCNKLKPCPDHPEPPDA